MAQAQFNPQFHQSPTPPDYNEGAVAQATLARNTQAQAAMAALAQLAGENQKIQLGRDELTRKVTEDERNFQLGLGQQGNERARTGIMQQQADTAGYEAETGRQRAGAEAGYQSGMLGLGAERNQLEASQQGEQRREFDLGKTFQEKQLASGEALKREEMSAEDKWRAAAQTGENERARLAAQAHVMGAQIGANATLGAANVKTASGPYEWNSRKYNLPADEGGQRAVAEMIAEDDLRGSEPYKSGAAIPKALLNERIGRQMRAMGIKGDDAQENERKALFDTASFFEKVDPKTITPEMWDSKRAEMRASYGLEAGGGKAPASGPAEAPAPAKPPEPLKIEVLDFKDRHDNFVQMRLLARDLRSTIKNQQTYQTQDGQRNMKEKQAKLERAAAEFEQLHGKLSSAERQQLDDLLAGKE